MATVQKEENLILARMRLLFEFLIMVLLDCVTTFFRIIQTIIFLPFAIFNNKIFLKIIEFKKT